LNLAGNADNQVLIAKEGAIPLLVRLLSTDNAEAHASAAGALGNLVVNADNKVLVAKEGAVTLLVGLLTAGHPSAQAHAASTLIKMGELTVARRMPVDPSKLMLKRPLSPEDHFVLSVKFTAKRVGNQSGEIVEEILGKLRTYNPNRFCKSPDDCYCQKFDGSCKGRCRKPWFADGETPTDKDCWTASYRQHLSCGSTRARKRAGRLPIMIRILEDGKLGPGQEVEKVMAEDLGVEVVELTWGGFDVTSGGDFLKQGASFVLKQQLVERLGDFTQV